MKKIYITPECTEVSINDAEIICYSPKSLSLDGSQEIEEVTFESNVYRTTLWDR